MSIDSAIEEQLALIRRRDVSRAILSEALEIHSQKMRGGYGVIVANEAFAARIKRGRSLLQEYAPPQKEEPEGFLDKLLVNPFEKALQVASDIAIRKAFQPYLVSLLNSLGLDDHPRFRELISGIIVDTVSRMVTQAIQGDIPFSKMGECSYISQTLAKSVAEAVPKTLFDTFLEPGKEPQGVMLTLREVIANYFAETETVNEIAAAFEKFVCKVSFADLVTRGAAEIEDAIAGSTTGAAR